VSVIERLRHRFERNEFLRAALTIVAGTGAAQLIVVLSSPILTRLYSPSDYGIYSVATSILVLSAVTCLRYEFAIPLPKDDVTAANLLGLSLLANVGMSLATAIVLLLVGPWLLGLFGASSLNQYVLLLAVAQFGGGVVSAFINWAVRTKNYSEIGVNRLTQSVALVGVQVSLGVLGSGAIGLLVGAVSGSLAGSTRLAQAAWRTHAVAFRQISRAGMLFVANRYRRFPIFSSGSALLANLGVRAPFLLLVAYFGTEIGGQYALAERVLYLPLTLVAGSVGQVFIAEGAVLARERPDELMRLFRRTTLSLALAAIGPAVAIAVAVPSLAGLVFGERWGAAGLLVAVLVPMFYVAFVMTSTGDVLYIVERQALHLVREILRFALLSGSLLLAAALHLSPLGAVGMLSAAGCLTYLLYGLISWYAIAHHRALPPPAEGADTEREEGADAERAPLQGIEL
jgi:O-antigen/teichoic acid export membrane protein